MHRGELTGQVLDGRYRVIEPIGEGAMGNVYRGERLKLGRVVAIKVMNDELTNEASRKRFEREAMAMAKLEHPHCASVLDVGVHADQPYVVMEFVSGQNLKELIKAGPVPILRAVEITRQVLSGLSHAHEHGVIHRDIKPANIVLSQKSGLGDQVKILDFGLARFNQETSNLTAGVVLGTPNYMAPEQIRGLPFDHRVDLYGCGVLLFELLTGVKPFQAADPVAVCMQHINEPPPRLADKLPTRAFGGLEEVVARALAKDPAQRYPSAEELSRAMVAASQVKQSDPTLKRVADVPLEPPSTATAPAIPSRVSPPRKRGRALVLAGGVLIAGAAAVVIVLATRSNTESPQPAPQLPRPITTHAVPPDADAVASSGDAIETLVARAKEMTAAGRRESAIDLLVGARKTYPKEARLPFEASKLYLEKMWWADGLKQARIAFDLDPKLKTDGDLIRLVLRGFNTTKSYDWTLAKFLRDDIGDAAKPFLEDTAKRHPNPIVRARASAELRRYR